MSNRNPIMPAPRDRSPARRRERELRRMGAGRMIRPTVGGLQTVHLGSAADENQPGYEISETIVNTATENIILGDTTWAGAIFVDYWMKSGTDSASGRLIVYQTGTGGVKIGVGDESGDGMSVTLAASLSGSAMRLAVTNNTGGDLKFTGRYYYAGV